MQMSQNIVIIIVKLMPAARAGITGQEGSELMVGEVGWSMHAQKTSMNVARNSAAIGLIQRWKKLAKENKMRKLSAKKAGSSFGIPE